ncbi:uncharacterized protein LOC127795266 [Diospyros lotus]|uniref:uncharacterized protein LOC127795266 n=1 Tax=Diospyros lotus TaxID=55363 RepID=UPI00224F8056|nr:uncharacterized protein LOC127795266 [Diospyros lotus]XP_052182801.1 uncharacterized protein LOC127795266 [Diospyros lotus]
MLPRDMWREKQENIMLPGQTCAPRSFQGSHMENMIPAAPSENIVLCSSSRKRKSTTMDQAVVRSDPIFGPWESNLHKASFLSGAHVEKSSGLGLDRTKSIEQPIFKNQYEKDTFLYQNSNSVAWPPRAVDVHANETKNLSNASSHLPPQHLDHKGSFDSPKMQAGLGILSNWQLQACSRIVPSEPYMSSPILKSYDTCAGEAPYHQEPMNIGMKNLPLSKLSPGICNTPCKSLTPEEILQHRPLNSNRLPADVGERQSNNSLMDGGSNELPSVKAATLEPSLFNEQLEEFSPENGSPSKIVKQGKKNDLTDGSLRSDEKSRSHFTKAAHVVAEKLWEGSLQLNSSVSLSAVAFFKSGEKLLDTNWCESIEVKGKVRLEAFEKYIQDLPRSRSRGLMVISLCWKEGSSGTGLKGMKEVAKGYQKGGRVGFAQLSPGIDLYVCPRSDAIITILAKYGFFKGMAAVEDNQDSMIGCVVWRRNRTSLNSVAKKPESKGNSLPVQLLNSPTYSPVKLEELVFTQPAQESLLPSASSTSTIEGAGKSGSEAKSITSTEPLIKVIKREKNFSDADSLPAASGPSDPTSAPAGLHRPSGSNSTFPQAAERYLLEVQAHPGFYSVPEQPKASRELKEPKPFSSNIRKEHKHCSEDDDLPEFDFNAARGVSHANMSKPSDTVLAVDKRIPPKGILKMHGSDLPKMSNVQAMSVSSQRSNGSDQFMLPRFPFNTKEGMPPMKLVGAHESGIPVFPRVEERPSIQHKLPTSLVGSAVAKPRNLFDDGDDMPEWRPPWFQKQPLAETRQSTTARPPELPNSILQNTARGSSWPVIPPASAAATRPTFYSQPSPPAFHCPTARPPGGGPNSSMGFNPTWF